LLEKWPQTRKSLVFKGMQTVKYSESAFFNLQIHLRENRHQNPLKSSVPKGHLNCKEHSKTGPLGTAP
jgi:hypothetical protein